MVVVSRMRAAVLNNVLWVYSKLFQSFSDFSMRRLMPVAILLNDLEFAWRHRVWILPPPRDCEGEAPRDCEGEAPRDCGGDCGEGASRDGGGEGSDCGPSPSARHVPSCPPRNCDWSGPLPWPSPGTSRRGGEQERSPELWWADLDSGFPPPPTTAGRGGTLDHEIAAAPYKLKKQKYPAQSSVSQRFLETKRIMS